MAQEFIVFAFLKIVIIAARDADEVLSVIGVVWKDTLRRNVLAASGGQIAHIASRCSHWLIA